MIDNECVCLQSRLDAEAEAEEEIALATAAAAASILCVTDELGNLPKMQCSMGGLCESVD